MMTFPEIIARHTAGLPYRVDSTGHSGSQVLLYNRMVLKIQPASPETEKERQMLLWLKGKLHAPDVIACAEQDGMLWLLMSRIPGVMSCDQSYMLQPARQSALLAKGLKQLWAVDISDCPVRSTLDEKLALAAYNVSHGLVDPSDAEPGTFGPGSFADPAALLHWLQKHRPEEELVLSHGDYCLPNILLTDDGEVGFIDLGRAGIADKWCDIALCCRSLSANYRGKYNGKAYPGLDESLLFRELGIEPDREKLRYYTLLDELF